MPEALTPDVEQLVDDYNALFGGDRSKLAVVSESYHFESPLGEVHGREGLDAFLREQETGFPDTNVVTEDIVVDQGVVMQEFTWTGTHDGEYEGIPATGRDVEVTGIAKLTIEGGEIQHDRSYFDSQRLFEQLGVTE